MAFYGYHGHHPSENEQGQRFLVDVTQIMDIAPAAASDRLGDTINYARAHDVCRRIMEQDRVKLLETLCARVIDALFAEFPRVARVEVTIRKPSAPIPGVLDYVSVTAACDRADRLPRPGK